ncbi:DUF5050 domain-containing protein [Candidatus Poribacteria bacterium]|nr:DUF5050 domain-containing protein [Candidatus Poribacteria bacterium]
MKPPFVIILLLIILFTSSSLIVSNVKADEHSVISFLSNEEGNYDIFIIEIDGRILQRLATDTMRKSSLTFSPTGYFFAYSSNQKGNPDIYKMDISDNKPIQLTQHAERNIWPAWSPNGEWIAFVSDREGTQNIYRMDVDGSNLIRLTDQGSNGKPAWSPDSQLLAFYSDDGITRSIYIMNTEGEQLKKVTDHRALFPTCTGSPDGKQIAYPAGNFDREGTDIFTIDVNGNNKSKITSMGMGFRSGNPAWSPDGKWIAYSVEEVVALPNPENNFRLIFSDSTIYLVDSKGNGDVIPLDETEGLSSGHVPVWISRRFFAVTPDESKQTVTWGKLKHPKNREPIPYSKMKN